MGFHRRKVPQKICWGSPRQSKSLMPEYDRPAGRSPRGTDRIAWRFLNMSTKKLNSRNPLHRNRRLIYVQAVRRDAFRAMIPKQASFLSLDFSAATSLKGTASWTRKCLTADLDATVFPFTPRSCQRAIRLLVHVINAKQHALRALPAPVCLTRVSANSRCPSARVWFFEHTAGFQLTETAILNPLHQQNTLPVCARPAGVKTI